MTMLWLQEYILQGEEPSLLKVPQEAGEYDRATNTRYDERPLKSVRHFKHSDPLKVHAEDPRDNPEDGYHKRSGGQQQLELDQLVPDIIQLDIDEILCVINILLQRS